MYKFLIVISSLFLLHVGNSFSQSFEGSITFKRITFKDTTDYIYSVKGDMVRIDEKNKKGRIQGTMLVDTKNKKITTVSHDRKVFMSVETKPASLDMSKTEVDKTKETKEILGLKCEKWIAKNTEQNTIAEFWVHKGNYDFFLPLLGVLNRKDKISLLYQKIPDANGYFSLYGEERSVDGSLKEQLQVVKVEKKKMPDTSFKIPAGYTKFETK
ncbi:MAG: DUF4412 domain-containing protein [Bacteroidetes bacterium]|nr:DUF4412 domain-containing protein [Bacteroidota bacterium]MBV6461378.1 hypothetical protein [Flavobacteriales bacterium]WKZ75221.1 MAG: DUF4412 domain-containing protein [Vicingaceae bacterium]MCL4816488.1 DUF4412 domain-containing protein [Flavobacteriales bacterium]NOG94416.1 DUF4412 domain-containing protein [Bacteroidota bacterium]